MKALLLAAAIIATPAYAFDANEIIRFLSDEAYTCETGENHDGDKIAEEDVADSCAHVEMYSAMLTENGYCKVGVDWKPCNQ